MKARVLTFDREVEDQDRFSLLYQGFVTGGPMQSKGMQVLRREASVLDKFERISSGAEGNELLRMLNSDGGQMVLSQPEFELLKSYFESAPWRTVVAQKVVDTADWLASIPLSDQE